MAETTNGPGAAASRTTVAKILKDAVLLTVAANGSNQPLS